MRPRLPAVGSDIVLNQMVSTLETVTNAYTGRLGWLKQLADPRRDIGEECGYPHPDTLSAQHWYDLWDIEPVAQRVVEWLPEECWAVQPLIVEDPDPDISTDFEEAFAELNDGLNAEKSWLRSEDNQTVWTHLKMLDTESRKGRYAIMLCGFADDDDLAQPLTPKKGRKLRYLRVFSEALAPVGTVEQNRASPRYGQPVTYDVTFADMSDVGAMQPAGLVTIGKVHYSRVVHLASDRPLSSMPWLGRPACRGVLRPLLDIMKVRGSSAEMYFLGAFPGFSFETHPELGGDVDIDKEAIKREFEQWRNRLSRLMVTSGLSMKSQSPQVVPPDPQIQAQLDAISIAEGIPKRVLMGSEQGQLASDQDTKRVQKIARARQGNRLTPLAIAPFVDLLIRAGALPEPEQWGAEWPDVKASRLENAQAAQVEMQVITAYVRAGADVFMSPMTVYTEVLGWDQDKAEQALEDAAEHAEEKMDQVAELADEGRNPDGTPKPPEAPPGPVAVKPGDKLVNPQSGEEVARGNPQAKPPRKD